MLDEVDKLGRDFRGDPSSALMEVLDPEQNNAFRDHYLDVPFDLSKVLFIATANWIDPIPEPLRDRMEIIELAGYTEVEKVHIAKRYLIPKQATEHGLKVDEHIEWTDDGLREMIHSYTREAGVRNLEREIATLTRKQARRLAEGKTEKHVVTPEVVRETLGVPKYRSEQRSRGAGEAAGRVGGAGVDAGRRRHRVHRGDADAWWQAVHHDRAPRRSDAGVHDRCVVVGARQRASATASIRTSSANRTSTFTCLREPCPRTALRPAWPW